MSEYKRILEARLERLKTDYITTTTNIERVEKDLNEAKTASIEMIGAIKNIELVLEQFRSVQEPIVQQTTRPLPTPKVIAKKKKK